MDSLLQDLRYGLRTLAKAPGFTAVAVLTLALGIGGNAAVFSLLNAALFGWSESFREPQRLVMVSQEQAGETWTPTPADFRDWRDQATSFEGLAAYHYETVSLATGDEPERAVAGRVSAAMLPLLGVKPILGRSFEASEEQWGRHRVAILGHGLWKRRFGGDAGIVGREIRIDSEPHRVVGILPPGAWFASTRADLFTPLAFAPDDPRNDRHSHFLRVVGRLRPGVTRRQADVEMDAIAARLARQYTENAGLAAAVDPLRETVLAEIERTLLILLGAVAFVLLIACANVANLFLARASERQREIGVRTALGASRARLVRQLLTESLIVSTAGGVLGLALAAWSADAAAALVPAGIPRLHEVGAALDTRVLGFALALSVATGLVFGTAPAWQGSRAELAATLKEGARGGAGRGRTRMRALLVAGQTGLALVLLAGAGLLIQSLWRLQDVDPGFTPHGLLTARIELPFARERDLAASTRFFEDVVSRVEALPGVAAAGVTSHRPLGGGGMTRHFAVEGRPAPATLADVPIVVARQESVRSLQAMGAPLRRGRLFTEADAAGAARVALVNEALARRFFPGEDPIGRTISLDPPEQLWPADDLPPGGRFARWTIVGVVGDVNYWGLRSREVERAVYVPYVQRSETMPWAPSYLVVRTDGDPRALVEAVRRQVRAVDAGQAVADFASGRELIRAALGAERFNLALLGSFAGLALVLAAVGLYGVVAYSVAQRAHEMGVRVALGARGRDLVALVVREGLRLGAAGVLAGLAAAWALTRLMSALLFEVSPADATAFAAAAVALLLVSVLASVLPARRAARVDPLAALKYE